MHPAIVFVASELNFMPWNDNLTGPHLEIAREPASPLRVLAGPGTGKSFALMRRISRLLEQGANPRRILVSTFTRTAAKDLENALAELGAPGVQDVYAGTLHSLSFSILNRAEVLAITGRTPRALMEFETRFLIQDLTYGGLSVTECKKHLQAFNAAWARLHSDTPGWLTNPEDLAFDHALRAWLVFHKAMLIGELVPECRLYLRNNPLCPERSRYDHVLVDEYQDLNRAEQELLDLLAGVGTMTVIGDENQSIYSFKHSHPEGIVEFPETHENTVDQSLTVCRRCPQRVVGMSNSLLLAHDPHARQLLPFPGNPQGEVFIVQWPSLDAEANGIAAMIHRRITAGTLTAGGVLVLAPRRQFAYAVRDALSALGVPAHSFFSEEELDGNPKELDESAAQQAFTLLTLLANPEDIVALRCWCGFGSASLRDGAWQRIRQVCIESGFSPRAVLNSLAAGTRAAIPYTNDLVTRYRLLLQHEATCAGLTGAALVDAVLPSTEPWAIPLRDIASDIEEADYPPSVLIEALRSCIVQPEMPTETDYVRIMSLHKSKGLTANFVAVVGLIEGLVPGAPDQNTLPAEQAAKLAEDRRVFYVALTRARQTVVLSSVTILSLADASRMRAIGQPAGRNVRVRASRFLNDLGPTAPTPIAGSALP